MRTRFVPLLAFAVAFGIASASSAGQQPPAPPAPPKPPQAPEPPGRYRGGPEQTDRVSQRARLGPNGTVTITNVNGDVTINAGSGDEVIVDALKRTRGGRERLDTFAPKLEVRPGRIEIHTDFTDPSMLGRRSGGTIDYTITVPASASVDAKAVSGNVKVSGVKGSVRATAINGNVTAAGTPQLDEARSVSGDVDVSDVTANADLAVSSVSGSVRVKNVKARGLNVNTVSGDVIVTGAACSRFTAKSVSGDVEYDGELQKGGTYDVNSHSGDVRLTIPSGVGFELDANTFNGSVRSELPLTLAPEPADRASDRGRDRRLLSSHSMHASYGDGSASLVLRTFSGNIVIAKR